MNESSLMQCAYVSRTQQQTNTDVGYSRPHKHRLPDKEGHILPNGLIRHTHTHDLQAFTLRCTDVVLLLGPSHSSGSGGGCRVFSLEVSMSVSLTSRLPSSSPETHNTGALLSTQQ